MRTRRPPLGVVQAGDVVHFKIVGGPLIGSARVMGVREYADLTPDRVRRLAAQLGDVVQAPASYWRVRDNSRYGIMIRLARLSPPPARLRVPRQFGSGWIAAIPRR